MKDIEEKIKYIIENPDMLREADIGLWRALDGAISEHMAYKDLKSNGFAVTRGSDATGVPDFTIEHEGREILVEHKRARQDIYKRDGRLKVEFHKSRKSGDCKSTRLYSPEWCDILSIDVSRHTGIVGDMRFVLSKNLDRHDDFPEKIKAIQGESPHWHDNLEDALKEILEDK